MNFHLLFFILFLLSCPRSRGVMVSTLDSESSDPSSNLGGTYVFVLVCSGNEAYLGARLKITSKQQRAQGTQV